MGREKSLEVRLEELQQSLPTQIILSVYEIGLSQPLGNQTPQDCISRISSLGASLAALPTHPPA